MLFVLFLFLLFKGYGTKALPVFPRESTPDVPEARTMFDIIWGCLSTIFICVWVSVHPNVPPPATEEYGWKSLLRRFRLMFWTLAGPELVLYWAVEEWKAAGNLAYLYNNRKMPPAPEHKGLLKNALPWARNFKLTMQGIIKDCIRGIEDWIRGRKYPSKKGTMSGSEVAWTRTHGYLLIMGGITLVEPDTKINMEEESIIPASSTRKVVPNTNEKNDISTSTMEAKVPAAVHPAYTILDMDLLKELLKNPHFDIAIAEEEIADKAKGDFLSKMIAFLQVSWFIIQCAARFAQGLAVTELEVCTLALASLNGLMYAFWWNKPLGLGVPFKVVCKHEEIQMARRELDHDQHVSGSQQLPVIEAFYDVFESVSTATAMPDTLIKRLLWFVLLPFKLALFAIFVPWFSITSLLALSIFDVTLRDSPATHDQVFYLPRTQSKVDITIPFIIIPSFACLFGGLHCIGWDFIYPSVAEKALWRVTSLIIMCFPVLPIFFAPIGALIKNLLGRKNTEILLITFTFLQISLYGLARLFLIIEAFVLLRQQPVTVFYTIDWTKFLPRP